MDPASSVAAELWRPHHHHHLEASSVVTAAARSGGGGSSSRRRPRRDAAASSEEEPYKLVSTSGTAASSSAGGQDSVRLPPPVSLSSRAWLCDLCNVTLAGVGSGFSLLGLQLQRREIVACAARRRDVLDPASKWFYRSDAVMLAR